jgi:hypothetical protein
MTNDRIILQIFSSVGKLRIIRRYAIRLTLKDQSMIPMKTDILGSSPYSDKALFTFDDDCESSTQKESLDLKI